MAKDAKNNKDQKNKKHFFKDFKAELKKVIWPTPKQLVNNTVAVIVIVLITMVLILAAIVFVLDKVFGIINEEGINRLKANIKSKVVVEQKVDEGQQNEENASENGEASDENEVQSPEENAE